MDIHRSFAANKHRLGILFLVVTFAVLFGTPAEAQQRPRLSARYAKAALSSLFAIESDSSTPRDEDSGTVEANTIRTIDAAGENAVTEKEKSITELLRQVYELKLQDNGVTSAYRKLMEIETAPAADEDAGVRNEKEYAVGQFADAEAVIMDREEPCLRELEQSLLERSAKDMTVCSEWVRKSKISGKSAVTEGPEENSAK